MAENKEFLAMKQVQRAISELDPKTAARVVSWMVSKFAEATEAPTETAQLS